MQKTITLTIAAALLTAAGSLRAENSAVAEPGSEPAPVMATGAQGVEYIPMTRSERLRNYLTGTFGTGALAGSGIHAAIDQLKDSPHEWGQDAAGYGQRLGNVYARHIIRGSLQYGAATLLHEDDRYFRSGQTGFFKRTKYAVVNTFLAHRDNGDRMFAFARIGSAAGASFIAQTWAPPSASGASHAASSFGFNIATKVGMNVVREFWPDVKRRFHKN
jgi:hypothetical protein